MTMLNFENLSYIVRRGASSIQTPGLVASALAVNINYLKLNSRLIDLETNPVIVITRVYPDGAEEFFAAISYEATIKDNSYIYGVYGRPEIREKSPYEYGGLVNRLDHTLGNLK